MKIVLLTFVFAALTACPIRCPAQESQADTPRAEFCLSGADVLSPLKDNPACTHFVERTRVQTPRLVHATDPKFPHGDRISGICILSLTVGIDGKPTDIVVKRSLRPDYDEQAVEAIRKFRFNPATLDGKQTAMQINIEQRFMYR